MLAGLNVQSQSIEVTNISAEYACVGSRVTVTFKTTNGKGNSTWFNTTTDFRVQLLQGTSNIAIGAIFQINTDFGKNDAVTINLKTTYTIPSSLSPGSYSIAIVSINPGISGTQGKLDFTVNDPGRWTGAVNSDYLNPGNWACGIIPDFTRNVSIPAVVPAPVVTAGTGLSNNLTIQANASLTVNSALNVVGNITNDGTLDVSAGSVSLGGSTARTIPSNLFAGNIIKDLTLNNVAGTSLTGPLKVSGILKALNGTFNTGGFLTLLSNSTKTAQIDGSGTGTVLGNLTIQGYLPSGYGYKYLSSPFQAAMVNELAAEVNLTDPFPTVYRYQEDKETAGWVNYVNPSGLLSPMQGYAFNLGSSAEPKTIEMSGVVNNGTLSINLSNNNRLYTQGFNLVGNPYPSPVDWNTAGGWVKTNIDNALYYFKAGGTSVYDGVYGSYVNGISTDGGISNNIIPAMQGFFVHVSNGIYPVSATLGINNSARTTLHPAARILKGKGQKLSSTSSGFHHSDGSGSKTSLRMQAEYDQGALISDQTVIYFDDEASHKFDRAYDALKLMNTDTSVPNLYTISSDAQNLSINALPNSADSVRTVPIGLRVEKSGFVDLSVSSLDDLPYGLKVYLMDAQSNILQNLNQNPAYRVNITAGTYEERFSILFSLKDLTIPQLSKDLFSAHYANGKFVYQLKGNAENSKASIIVSNMNGQVMHRSDFRGADRRELPINLSPGIYVVTCLSEIGIESKKALVN